MENNLEKSNEDKIEVDLSLSGVVLGIALVIGIIGISLIFAALT